MSYDDSSAAIAPRRRTRGRAPAKRSRGSARPVKRRRPEDNPRLRGQMESAATMSLVLGLLAFAVLPLIGPFAIMKGNEASKLARRIRVPAPGTATAGVILGWIATIGMILGLLAVAFLVVMVIAAA
jgi:hypothetical protein